MYDINTCVYLEFRLIYHLPFPLIKAKIDEKHNKYNNSNNCSNYNKILWEYYRNTIQKDPSNTLRYLHTP